MNVFQEYLYFSFVLLAITAPILFFEHCDEGNLLTWVRETRNVTDEIEDQMINFAIHIAEGMHHMHHQGGVNPRSYI